MMQSRTESRMAAFRRSLCASATSARLRVSRVSASCDGPPHRRRQAVEAALDQVVGRAELQALHRLLLADRAGHEDHRHVGLGRLGLFQRGDPVIAGQVVVGDDEIEGFLAPARIRSRPCRSVRRISQRTPSTSSRWRISSASRGLIFQVQTTRQRPRHTAAGRPRAPR